MKKYFKDLFRTTSIIAIWIIISVWSLAVFAAITWPGNNPAWQPTWWLFQTYFNIIFDKCDDWEVLQWYEATTKKPICKPLYGEWGGNLDVSLVFHSSFSSIVDKVNRDRVQSIYDAIPTDKKARIDMKLKTWQQMCSTAFPWSVCVGAYDLDRGEDGSTDFVAGCTDYGYIMGKTDPSFAEDVIYCLKGWIWDKRVDVPLNNIDYYDTNCDYRVRVIGIDWHAKAFDWTTGWFYVSVLNNKFLTTSFLEPYAWGVPYSKKNQYGYRNANGVFTQGHIVDKVEKRCN